MTLVEALGLTLYALGAGFLIANLLKLREIGRWWRRRSTAQLVWTGPKPPYYGLMLGIGMALGLLILFKAYVVFRQFDSVAQALPVFGRQAFGELMMFAYYGYMLPLSTRISRGLYADGVWTDTGFMPYEQIGGISWREGDRTVLVLISRCQAVARRLEVPGAFLGQVRRLLRDKISSQDIEMDEGPGLHLGARDARDSV